jgi:adenylate cyclase
MEFKLEYLLNEEIKILYLTKDTLTAGKLPENDLLLDDKTISRRHCRFEKTKSGYKLVDLNSTNGSYVNGQRINEKELQEGDNIALGRTILKFLAVSPKENFYDVDDQKISVVIPLSEDLKVKTKPDLEKGELNFLTALTELGKKLIASSSLEDSFEKIGGLIFEHINLKRLFIFSYDEKQEDLHLIHSQSQKGKRVDKVNISKTIAMKSIKEKVAILSSNTRDDARFDGAESIILYGITSAMSIPIWTKNSIYGLIYADTTHFEEMFSERDLEIMSIIANFTGLSIEGINSLNKLNREKKIRSRLERYLSPSIVSKIMESQDDISNEFLDYKESEASVLFVDIVGFTPKAENMKPVETGIFLNNFFTEMTEIIFRYRGTLDKYLGDGIMAVFGVPFPIENHSELSILTALDMLKKLEELNAGSSESQKIKIRIGINSGKLIAGDFGSPKRFDYTVLGNTVNIASRLESSVAGPDEIVVTEAVYQKTKNIFDFENFGEKKLTGIKKPVKTFKVIGKKVKK